MMAADRHDRLFPLGTQMEALPVQSLSTLQDRPFPEPPVEDVGGVGAGAAFWIAHDEGVPLRRILSTAWSTLLLPTP